MQEFFKCFCDDDDWVHKRRNILRRRAGLKDEDTKLVLALDQLLRDFPLDSILYNFECFTSCTLHEHNYIYNFEVPKFRFVIMEGDQMAEREVHHYYDRCVVNLL